MIGLPCVNAFVAISLGFLSRVAAETAREFRDQSCSTESILPSAGSQLLQLRQGDVSSKLTVQCFTNIGKEVPLDEAGFEEVANSCCYDDMRSFIQRLAGKMDMKICDEGGLSGFAPHYSCSNESTLLALTEEMQAAPGTKCAWLGRSGEACAPIHPSCGVNLNPMKRKSLLKGYIGIEAANNPPALVRSESVRQRVKETIADKLGVPAEAVEISIGTGPVGSASFFQVAMKSLLTGRYVEPGPDGHLVTNSPRSTTFEASLGEWGNTFHLGGVSSNQKKRLVLNQGAPLEEVLVKWNENDLSFQTSAGEHVAEDEDGHVVLSRNIARRLQVAFPGTSFVAFPGTSFLGSSTTRRSCTVTVSYDVLQTEPPSIDEEKVKENADKLDVLDLQANASTELVKLEPCLGKLEIATFKYCKEHGTCENKSLKPAHSDKDYHHSGEIAPNITNSTKATNSTKNSSNSTK